MTVFRCFAWNQHAGNRAEDGPLWFPRAYQGDGRHDNPQVYGCLYLADRELSCVVEQLARFRGRRLVPALLVRRGLPLAVATIELSDRAILIDLDDPKALARHGLRPSRVATRDRAVTQVQALALHRLRPPAAGIRWWSVFEAQWMNATLFHRASRKLRLREVRGLDVADIAVRAAARFLGIG